MWPSGRARVLSGLLVCLVSFTVERHAGMCLRAGIVTQPGLLLLHKCIPMAASEATTIHGIVHLFLRQSQVGRGPRSPGLTAGPAPQAPGPNKHVPGSQSRPSPGTASLAPASLHSQVLGRR